MATVELKKKYQTKVLEELVDDKELANQEGMEVEESDDFDLEEEIQDPDFRRALELARLSRLEAKQTV